MSISRGVYNVIVAGCKIPDNPAVLGIGAELNGNMIQPFAFKEDLAQFADKTTGHICLCGSKTFFAIPTNYRPLKNRLTLVITSKYDEYEKTKKTLYGDRAADVVFLPSLSDGIIYYEKLIREIEYKNKQLFIIGGGVIYNEFIENYSHLINKLYLTEVYNPFKCTVYFPLAKYLPEKNIYEIRGGWQWSVNNVPIFKGLDICYKFSVIDYKYNFNLIE